MYHKIPSEGNFHMKIILISYFHIDVEHRPILNIQPLYIYNVCLQNRFFSFGLIPYRGHTHIKPNSRLCVHYLEYECHGLDRIYIGIIHKNLHDQSSMSQIIDSRPNWWQIVILKTMIKLVHASQYRVRVFCTKHDSHPTTSQGIVQKHSLTWSNNIFKIWDQCEFPKAADVFVITYKALFDCIASMRMYVVNKCAHIRNTYSTYRITL